MEVDHEEAMSNFHNYGKKSIADDAGVIDHDYHGHCHITVW